MPTKNIFAGYGAKSEFVNLIYTELMKREFVSYTDILAMYCKRPKGYYDKMACNSEPGYGELKKAFPEVLKALEKACPRCIEDNGRWFVFGEANREPYQAYNVPLDRIIGEVCEVNNVEYIPAEKGFYQNFFDNIRGSRFLKSKWNSMDIRLNPVAHSSFL